MDRAFLRQQLAAAARYRPLYGGNAADPRCHRRARRRDLTRIARINAALCTELFFDNSSQLLPAIDRYMDEMQLIRDAIAEHDAAKLTAAFERSTARREALDD